MPFNEWYKHDILHLADCPKCGHPIEIMAVDSSGHEIIHPCQKCMNDWKQEHHLKVETEVRESREVKVKKQVKKGRKK